MLNKPQKALKLNASKSKGDVSKSKWDVSKVKRNVSKNASKTKWDSLAPSFFDIYVGCSFILALLRQYAHVDWGCSAFKIICTLFEGTEPIPCKINQKIHIGQPCITVFNSRLYYD